MKAHVDTVGLLFLLFAGLQLASGIALAVLMLGFGGLLGAVGVSEGDGELAIVGGAYGVFGLVGAAVVTLFAIPNALVGYGLRRRRPWARIGGLVMAVLELTSFPLGTILGVYAIVTLVDAEVAAEFAP